MLPLGDQPKQSSLQWKLIIIVGFIWVTANALALWYLNAPHSPREMKLSDDVLGRFELRSLRQGETSSHRIISTYRLLKPREIEKGKQYPLMVFLHGSGERGNDDVKQLPTFPVRMSSSPCREEYPCFLLAPQCPEHRFWGERPALSAKNELNNDPLDDVVAMIHEVSKEFPVDPRRIYLTGHSMGAYGIWNLAAREPQLFAAIAPLSGGGDPETAKKLTQIPIWAFHGEIDRVVSASATREMVEAIEKAGGKPRFTLLPGIGHRIRDQVYHDKNGVVLWMFGQMNP